MQNIAIVGAGAIGGWLGEGLARAGATVSVLARGATLEAVRTHGLRVRQDGRERAAPVRVSDSADDLGPQDLVILAVKAPSLPTLAPHLTPLLAPHTSVLTAMNGVPWWFLNGFGGEFADQPLESVDPGGTVTQLFEPHRVIGAVVLANYVVDAPGITRHHAGNKVIVGEPSGADTDRVRALAELLRSGGIDTEVSERIQRDIWYKLWGNMTVNPISALAGATVDRLLDDDDLRGFISAVMDEAKTVGEKLGLSIDQSPADRQVVTRKMGASKTSMLQDTEAGRPIELDALVGSVLELARLTETPAPYTAALMGLTRVFGQMRGVYQFTQDRADQAADGH